MVNIYSIYNRPADKPKLVCGESLTQQQFKEECDINKILERALRTGVLPVVPGAIYGDFTDVASYQDAHDALIRANEAFMSLPARIRDRFDNDPARLLEFLSDEANREEAVKLGLVEESQPPEEVAVPVAPSDQLPT